MAPTSFPAISATTSSNTLSSHLVRSSAASRAVSAMYALSCTRCTASTASCLPAASFIRNASFSAWRDLFEARRKLLVAFRSSLEDVREDRRWEEGWVFGVGLIG